ncbi:hypothetical protein OIU77_021840 [Salix suchowensis]|uniref:Pentatricopeptide repeat-containing protein n=1 Tax=Salix suchowensis TaxID=1278906 RepID=A0ABQ9CE72_9ROSI|nr:hypothetical protein OIU77_021840 [Salix suchowensis]
MNTKLISKTLIQNQNTIITRSYYTNRYNKSTLYSKISPLGSTPSLEPELDSWVQSGNKVRVAELQRIIHDLRKRKRFSHALQVSEWMHKKDICIFSPSEHAVQLDLIGRVHGLVSAENYFNNLRDQDKNEKTYGALLNCYVRQRETDKSILHLQKMKEMGFVKSSLTYNDIMCLYTNVGQHEMVPQLLNEMKENYVLPDNFSYRLCINSYGARGDLEGMEKILNEMEHQPDIVMDWNTYAVAANFYINRKGLCEKAKALLEDLTGKGKMTLPNSWGIVATGFFDKSEVAKAFSCMKAALCLYTENKGWKPNQRVINGILSWLGDEGSAEDAEAFVSSLNTVIPMNREMYHAVLKANIRAGKEVHGLLDGMKAYKIKEDEETKKILSMIQ